jgi:anti-sigma regulatory factor (Ser/Thr protein kinase)
VTEERELQLVADADGARSAAEATRALLAACDPLEANACELAVMEACANVVEHAYGGAGGPLRVVLRLRPGRFSAAVCDQGPPFEGDRDADLPAADAEGGRGLVLLGLCMHRHEWRRVDEENRLLMSRNLPEAA